MNEKFLNSDRTSELWSKVKEYVREHGGAGGGLPGDLPVIPKTLAEYNALSTEERQSETMFIVSRPTSAEEQEWWSPMMTSDNTPTPFIARSSASGFGHPFYAFDNSLGTYWMSSNTANPWISIFIGGGKTIAGLKMRPFNNNDNNRLAFPKVFTIDGSNDGIQWETVFSADGTEDYDPQLGEYRECLFSRSQQYSYYRISMAENYRPSESDHYCVISDIQLLNGTAPFPTKIKYKDETLNAGGDTTYLVRAPIGTIVIWSGTADNIPTGWQLCDGTNGTPDLRDKFVLGAGTAHSVGETGGSEEVTLTVAQMPSHTHEIGYYRNVDFSGSGAVLGSSGLGEDITGSTGGDQSHPNMPPYYALCYIKKLTADSTDGVTSINGESGDITLAAGDNISITKTGKTITISATGGGPSLQSLSITTPPDKTQYRAGDTFDPSGMETYAAFSDDSGIYVDKPSLTFTPSGELTTDDTAVEVSFSFGGKTVTAEQPISVINPVWWSPQMTSDNTPAPYAASASAEYYSSTYGTFYAYLAFTDASNGNGADCWYDAASSAGAYITFGFGEKTPVSGLRMKPSGISSAFTAVFPKRFYILGSDDGTTWDTLYSADGTEDYDPTSLEWRECMFEKPKSYRYFRVITTGANYYPTSPYQVAIAQIEFSVIGEE